MEIPEMRSLGWADADAHASGDGVGYEESRPPLLGCLSFLEGWATTAWMDHQEPTLSGQKATPREVPSCALPL